MATTGDAERGVGEVFGDLGNISDIPAEVQGERAPIEPVVVDLEQDDDSNRQQEPPMPMQEKVEVVVTPKEGSDGVSVAFRVRPSFVTFRVEKVQADVASLTAKVDAILAHLSIPQPATMAR